MMQVPEMSLTPSFPSKLTAAFQNCLQACCSCQGPVLLVSCLALPTGHSSPLLSCLSNKEAQDCSLLLISDPGLPVSLRTITLYQNKKEVSTRIKGYAEVLQLPSLDGSRLQRARENTASLTMRTTPLNVILVRNSAVRLAVEHAKIDSSRPCSRWSLTVSTGCWVGCQQARGHLFDYVLGCQPILVQPVLHPGLPALQQLQACGPQLMWYREVLKGCYDLPSLDKLAGLVGLVLQDAHHHLQHTPSALRTAAPTSAAL